MRMAKKKIQTGKKEVYKQSQKGTETYKKELKQQMTRKRETKEKTSVTQYMPRFCSLLLFTCCWPQTALLYKMVWNDSNSDEFFDSIETTVTWVAALAALEGASAVALGYIDYGAKMGNSAQLIQVMRKKRLAFAKGSFIMAIAALLMVDVPSPSAVGLLIMG
jgi:hypothetical protein